MDHQMDRDPTPATTPGPMGPVYPPEDSRSLTEPLKNDGWKTTFLLGWYIFRGYVKLPGSKSMGNPVPTTIPHEEIFPLG